MGDVLQEEVGHKEKGIDQLMGKTFLGGKTLVGELRNSVNKIRESQIPTQGPQS